MNTAAVSLAVTPAVVSTLLSHYLNRKPLAHKPTAHLSYDQGLHLIRSFLEHASRHTVEELQDFTGQWVPHPQWVKVDRVEIPEEHLLRAADLLAEQLGPEGIRQVGGKAWWQWRKPKSPLDAEWIEMKADYHERKKNADPGNRVMLYVHGGAYYFGSVDEHRYQIQRHARKLKARALAPRYRLAPQFPFPCGLQDCLATYLHLITHQKPNTVILAGDSAGAGMVLSMMVVLRDQGIPLPAGAVLISPWVDLTHSFPSVGAECPLDYIPSSGFHHKPSAAWPPPGEDELRALRNATKTQKREAQGQEGERDGGGTPGAKDTAESTCRVTFTVDGEEVEVKEQIQMYTTNELLTHPLVSPILQPTLGGLPPLLIMVGGGELLRDEQIYLAHKCANPKAHLPPEAMMDEKARALVDRYQPTNVQLQVWDDLCHVGPTLSFTRPAKFMYRSVAQFAAWALARAQGTEVDILHDSQISVISSSSSTNHNQHPSAQPAPQQTSTTTPEPDGPQIGRAGDPLPPFTAHLIRQRVSRHGAIFPLAPATSLPGCCMPREQVGLIKFATAARWLAHRRRWDARFRHAAAGVRKKRVRDAESWEAWGEGEYPPPSALAGRRGGREMGERGRVKGVGLALWGLWGSKHDEMTVKREEMAGGVELTPAMGPGVTGSGTESSEGSGTDKEGECPLASPTGLGDAVPEICEPASSASEKGKEPASDDTPGSPSPDDDDDFDRGVTGKRVIIGGLATPFSLRKEPETASMITLRSQTDAGSARSSVVMNGETAGLDDEKGDDPGRGMDSGLATPLLTPASVGERGLEKFVTAEEGGSNGAA